MAVSDEYDAIVVGAGHNGLVAALYLAKAGLKTLVLERNARIGGAVKSGEITRPGFIHDLFATNQNLFCASPVYREFQQDLARHGLRFCVSPKPYCNVFPDGTSLRIYQNPEQTLDLMRHHNPKDAEGWSYLNEEFKVFCSTLLPLYGTPLPSLQAIRVVAQAAREVGVDKLSSLIQIVLSSTRELGQTYFESEEARALISSWGMHLDYGPSVSGGAMFPFLEAFADMNNGMAIAEGGASRIVDALAGMIREKGGEIRTDSEVRRILTVDNRVSAVELGSGEQIGVRRAVIANVTPTILFGQLLKGHPVEAEVSRRAEQYRYGPGTLMVHLALSGPPKWAAGEDVGEFAYVHIGPYMADMDRTYSEAVDGYLPSSPFLIVGQTSVVDPSRAPAGKHVLWIQVRVVPASIRGDAAGEIAKRQWEEVKEVYADRVIQKLETYAPGIRDLILDRVVFSPEDLERENPNLVGGDSLGGSHHLRQNFLFRPFPGWSTYRMPVDGLFMAGASTWPGAGTNAVSGYLAAQQVIHPHAVRDRIVGGALALGLAATAAAVAAKRLGGRR